MWTEAITCVCGKRVVALVSWSGLGGDVPPRDEYAAGGWWRCPACKEHFCRDCKAAHSTVSPPPCVGAPVA